MENLMQLATAKVVKKRQLENARGATDVGSYDVDFWAHITGKLNVGEDYETPPTVAIPYKRAFAALAHVAGCTGKHGIAMIRRAMEIALADENRQDGAAREALARICPMVEKVESEVITPMIRSLPPLNCNGKITTKLDVEFTDRR